MSDLSATFRQCVLLEHYSGLEGNQLQYFELFLPRLELPLIEGKLKNSSLLR